MLVRRITKILFVMMMSSSLFSQIPQVSSGKIKQFEKFTSQFVTSRNVDVWLPDGYDKSKKYAVLYMHDGQMLFDASDTWNGQEWQVDEVLSRLIKDGKVRDCIVVGISNDSDMRWSDYNPQKALSYLPEYIAEVLLSEKQMGKSSADNYLKFLVTELKPFIDETFSTHSDQSNTFVMGSSMGGLISMYAICEYPDVFGGAACLSTHWIGDPNNFQKDLPEAYNKYLSIYLPDPANHKIYFDHGTETLDSLYKPYQDVVDKTMKERGYNRSNWMTKEFVGDAHDEKSWAARLDIPLVFLLRKE